MLLTLVVLSLISGVAFLFYGYGTLFKETPRGEFDRYGMPDVRQFVGTMQILGGAGVLIGLGFAPLGAVAATGLTLMMLLGLIVRLKIHDAPRLMMPAGTLFVVNAALVALFVSQ